MRNINPRVIFCFEHTIFVMFFILFVSVGTVFADTIFTATLDAAQVVSQPNSPATGSGSVVLNSAETQIAVTLNFSGLSSSQTAAHIHGFAGRGGNAGVLISGFPSGNFTQTFAVTPDIVTGLKAGLWYFDVHSTNFPAGEIRGQIEPLCTPVPSGLVAWYKGDGDALDASGNNNHGGLNGGVSFANGKVGRAFSFDGIDDRVVIPDSSSTRPTNALTIDVWVKPAQISQQGQFVAKFDSTNSQKTYYFGTDETGGRIQFAVYNSAGNVRRLVTDNNILTVNTLLHLTAVFDAQTQAMKIYADGAEVPASLIESSTVSSFFNGSSPIFLGTRVENATFVEFFKGLLDEVQIYHRALSATEIQSINNAGSAGMCQVSTFTPNSVTNPTNGKIAFVSDRTGNYEIFTMNSDGSNQTNITNNAANDDEPAWSFDGAKIAFYSNRNGNNDIYIANADGSNQIQLTSDSGADEAPSFSPDGTKIVFASYRTGGGDIYVMNSNGSNQTRLTTTDALDYAPRFSPDGSKIVFWSRRSGESVFIMDADGSNQINLTNGSGDEFPAFSPDGTKIAFIRNAPYDIYVINANGSNLMNITNSPGRDVLPAWSPDGTKIVFDTDRNGNEEIYTMNADGSNPTRLTNNSAYDYYPAWQQASGSVIVPVTIAPVSNVNVTFANVTQAGNTVATPLTLMQVPPLPSNYNVYGGGIYYDIRTSALYSGNITVSLNVPNVADVQTCSRLRLLHFENGGWTAGVFGAPSYNAATQVCTISQTVTSLSPFAVAETLVPTAANSAVKGRVQSADGQGIRNARVTLTMPNGETRSVVTGSFGNFGFDELPSGQIYVITVSSKRYTFDQPVQVINLNGDAVAVSFTATN
ncbi:MAG TPA: CHRD domain-containing protein [Pyrinomonadaceae bacterium]|nr:CHRD domain-containing protein [Pyrinomonadaceae bacterium]